MQVPYFRPSIGEVEKARVAAVLDSGWLTTGRVVKEFETRFAEYVGAPYAVASTLARPGCIWLWRRPASIPAMLSWFRI